MKKIISVFIIIVLILTVYFYCYLFNNSFKKDTFFKEIVIENNELNEYVLGVLACEMPALYEEDALKAQAIAIRTFALFIGDYKNSKGQCYITKDEMKEKWQSNYQKYYKKLKKIVDKTSDLVIYKDNKLLKTFYFSTSNGYTLSSLAVFNEKGIDGVMSNWDKNTKDYKKITCFNYKDLINKLGNFKNIKIIERDKTNHILKINVDDKSYTGIEFRKLLSLRSTDFEIEIKNNNYCFTTYGYGHGVGMSQSGANELAKLGYNYEYILKYYYGNINIKKYV